MNQTYLQAFAVAGASALLTLASASAATISFEDLTPGPQGYWNGSGGEGGFTTGGATFLNDYNAAWGSWSGFGYSTLGDTTTAGYGNQYSSYAGGGAGGSTAFGVSYVSGASTITFASAVDMTGGGASFTNTTYAALSMLQGDDFAKKFGGATGNDADWFLLTIQGYSDGIATGSVDVYLADYRFEDNSQDYILSSWLDVDLSDLGIVDEIQFSLTSSDVGSFGMNTPSYFAIDNLTIVPEASSSALLALAGLGLLRRRR